MRCLADCPFCGGGAVVSAEMADYPQIACDACGASLGALQPGIDAAIAVWNRRAASKMSTWQLIDTAPATRFTLNATAGKTPNATRLYWVLGGWAHARGSDKFWHVEWPHYRDEKGRWMFGHEHAEPTHWAPLPDPPEEKAELRRRGFGCVA